MITQPGPVFDPPPEPVPFTPDPSAVLPATAEVVVVAGGIVGASAAYHLAKAGMRPLVIEANVSAFGGSGGDAGMALAGLLAAELIAHGEARTLPLAPFDPRRYIGAAHAPTWLEPFQGTTPLPR